MAKALKDMSVAELESTAFELTKKRHAIREQAIAVQTELGKRNEQERISKLLGRNVQIVEVPGIESEESV